METRAQARFVRISPRKARLVVGLVRGAKIEEARDQLSVLPKKASEIVLKVLNSAVANAEHNNHKKAEDLIISQAYVDEGPTLKRWRPRAFGRAAQIRKRTSHITIFVGDKKDAKKATADKKKNADGADSTDKNKTPNKSDKDGKKDTRNKKQDTNKAQKTNLKEEKKKEKKKTE